MPRLFTALEVPQDAALGLSLLRGGLQSARWIDTQNYHVTLRFIGDVSSSLADEIASAFDRIARAPFEISLSGVGQFGGKKPHSIWAGVTVSPEMILLQAEIERICQRLHLDPDPRKFVPHVTLARLRNTPVTDVASYLSSRGGFTTKPFKVGRFVLLSSRDSVGGGPYITEEVYPLVCPTPATLLPVLKSNDLR